MARILVVGGETSAVQSALAAVSAIDGSPISATGLVEARQSLTNEAVELVVLDVSLAPPGDEAMAVFVSACQAAPEAPRVLALIPDRDIAAYAGVMAFDDFAVAPFHAQELTVRLQRLLKHAVQQGDAQVLSFGDLVIDPSRYEVTQEGRRMDLTFKEYELLKFLATSAGKVFSREALLNHVWGYDYFGGTRTVDVHVRRLRSKIEDASTTFIETVRNVGYRFAEPR